MLDASDHPDPEPKPAPAESPPAHSFRPDWDCIPFEVVCGRCGQNLRGQTEPRCPRCGLQFEWDEVLPVERWRCPECGYHLLGLDTPRCPECGRHFSWQQVLSTSRRANRLFEYGWRTDPVRSFVRTALLAAFRPRRLWSHYDVNQQPQLGPLLTLIVIQWLIFTFGYPAVGQIAKPMMDQFARWLGTQVRFTYAWSMFRYFLPAMLAWYGGTFLALQLFFQSNRRFRVGWSHTLRVYVHATFFAALCPMLWCVLEAMLDAMMWFGNWRPIWLWPPYERLEQGVETVGVIVTWACIWIGYRRYLKMPRGWAIAGACLLIGYLLARVVDKYYI
jgi:DNA-directed RNA polymerase subunit RPC12/RpoP